MNLIRERIFSSIVEVDLEVQVYPQKAAESMERDKPIPSISNISSLKQGNPSLPLASLQLLKEYKSKMKGINREKHANQSSKATSIVPSDSTQVLSTDGIMKMAKARILDLSLHSSKLVTTLAKEFLESSPCLPPERYHDFQLALLFHLCVLKYTSGQLDRARKLLRFCQDSAPFNGSPVERVVHYYAEAFQERIDREMKTFSSEPSQKIQDLIENKSTIVDEVLIKAHPVVVKFEQELPLCLIPQFTAIQTIMEHVGSAKRVHLVDLGIRSGSRWTILMQALADGHECPLELLKLSAVGPSKDTVEEMGKMLSSFAKTMNVPFTFKLVLTELKNLEEEMFELEAGERVVIYSDLRLAALLPWPDRLESVVVTIKKLNPCLMVVSDHEASINSASFMERLYEALPLHSAYFDLFEDCLGRNNQNRLILEEKFVRPEIYNMIAAEDEDRVCRKERIQFWRSFFARFGIVEIQLSDSALFHAKLVSKRNARWGCTLENVGKSLVIGWNGTAVKFLSAWKFQ